MEFSDRNDRTHDDDRPAEDYPRKRIKTDNAPFECPVCDNVTFTEKRSLLRHQRSAAHCEKAGLPVQYFACNRPPCQDNRFTREDLLLRHVKEVHDGVRRGQTVQNHHAEPVDEESEASTAPERGDADSNSDPPTQSLCHKPHGLGFREERADEMFYQPTLPEPAAEAEQTISDDLVGVPAQIGYAGTVSSRNFDELLDSVGSAFSELGDPKCSQLLGDLSDSENPPPRRSSAARIRLPLDRLALTMPRSSLLAAGASGRPHRAGKQTPCPLCHETIGSNFAEAVAHLHRHFQDFDGEYVCTTCQVGFVHKQDLDYHTASATSGTCGYDFTHLSDCLGHHPPENDDHVISNHDLLRAACHALRHWEQSQLWSYWAWMNDALTQDPLKDEPQCWSIAGAVTGEKSSKSVRSDNITWYSTPADVEYSTLMDIRGLRESTQRTGISPEYRENVKSISQEQQKCLNEQLMRSIQEGSIHQVTVALESGADANASLDLSSHERSERSHKTRPLIAAAAKNRSDIIERLIQYGACPNEYEASNDDGTALWTAARLLHPKAVVILLRHGVDRSDNPTLPALTRAMIEGHRQAFNLLLIAGADPNCCSEHSPSALSVAVELQDKESVKALLVRGADPNRLPSRLCTGGKSWRKSCLCTAVANQDPKITSLLLDHGASNLRQALCIALEEQSGRMTSFLLENAAFRAAFPAIRQASKLARPLRLAMRQRHFLAFEFIVNRRSSIPNDHECLNEALASAVFMESHLFARLLLGQGANPNQSVSAYSGRWYASCLIYACASGKYDLAATLVEHKADLNTVDAHWGPALQAALRSGHDEIARLLINAGAELHIKGLNHHRLVLFAMRTHDHEMFHRLADAGIGANAGGGRQSLVAPLDKIDWITLAKEAPSESLRADLTSESMEADDLGDNTIVDSITSNEQTANMSFRAHGSLLAHVAHAGRSSVIGV